MKFISPSFGLCSVLLGASAARAFAPAHPPYLSLRHRSVIIARADAPPACASKQLSANSTNSNATNVITTALGGTTNSTVDPVAFNNGNSTGVNVTAAAVTSPASVNASAPLPTGAVNSTVTDPLVGGNGTANSTINLTKRLAQFDLPDVATAWQELCLISGADVFTPTGDDSPCVKLAGFDGINALLANAGPCDQQDNADAMIDFAKSPGVSNSDVLINFAIQYRKHARNALNVLGVVPSTPYCQKPPRNAELKGIVNSQLDGVDPGVFGGPNSPMVSFGAPGTCPFGTTPDVATCSCIPGNATNIVAPANATATFDEGPLPSATVNSTATFDEGPLPTDSATANAIVANSTASFDEGPLPTGSASAAIADSTASFDEGPLPTSNTNSTASFDDGPLPTSDASGAVAAPTASFDEGPLPTSGAGAFDEGPLP
ncbi:hypothetical protein PC9H_000989 [Pleurotus ostreatus]|uniref:Uncharacterized protein n=1 Tax=Pleurotus ostreatus TaxID=5322 RepID=A0A8H7A5T0_PLEOS|nr:uncharacterized protein PC9H_000989 [Pleurotus ostreatus]KAF7440642.1 hypothetical protein PC9H_000989 [Pleurotus ostreatus]KAJ8699976.1 hypothetical protein PTI98_003048 [Pleurotus ostreatus]